LIDSQKAKENVASTIDIPVEMGVTGWATKILGPAQPSIDDTTIPTRLACIFLRAHDHLTPGELPGLLEKVLAKAIM
jgi:hypothetical protein